MRGTLFSSDFVVDTNGNERLLEINTDTAFLNSALSGIDFTEFFTVLNNNNITEINVVYKDELHSNFVNHLSSSIVNDAPFITSFVKTIVPSNTIFPTTVEDSGDKFVLRLAYDETSILDSEYAKGTLNLLKLFVDEGDSGSVCNFYHSSSVDGLYNTLDYQINDSSLLPDLVVKPIVERRVSSKFYKLGKQELTAETRYDEFITNNVESDTMIQQYHFNENSITDNNKITSLRSFKIVYGPNLDLVSLVDYEIESILDLPTDLNAECDNTIIDNLLSSKHYYEFATNFTKLPISILGGLLGTHEIVMEDGTFKEIQDIVVGDRVQSYFISGSPQSDNLTAVYNWSTNGNVIPEGSYLTSSAVVNVYDMNITDNLLSEIKIGNDKIYTSLTNTFLVYESDKDSIRYKTSLDVNPANDFLINHSGSNTTIDENNLFILNEDTGSKIVELNVENVDTYLISGSENINSSIVILHNRFCFIGGTKITMADGTLKNIEDVIIGDEVITLNEKTKLNEVKKVIDTKSPTHNDLVKYTLSNGVEVTSTFDHPFYVNKMELASYAPKLTNERYQLDVHVRKIQKSDCVYMIPKNSGLGMHAVAIEKIEPQPLVDTQTYIFTVEDNHNFYANGILTHNK